MVYDCREAILSEEYVDFISDYRLLPEYQGEERNFCYTEIDDPFGIISLKQKDLSSLRPGVFGYGMIPKVYGLCQMEEILSEDKFSRIYLQAIGSLDAQRAPMSLTGSGVAIGFVDTGIDYGNPVFQDAYGNTRIAGIWDQTVQEGEPPEGFSYGTYYRREEIQSALGADVPQDIVPSTDYVGHGTAMASVAAGSILGEGSVYQGAAPEAIIYVVKCKQCKHYLRNYYQVPEEVQCFQESDIMEAVSFLEKQAIDGVMPMVIVIGIGTTLGAHNGTGNFSRYLDQIGNKRNRMIVLPGGNEGDAARHFAGYLSETVEMRVGEATPGFTMEIWGKQASIFAVRIRHPNGELTEWLEPILSASSYLRNGTSYQLRFLSARAEIYADVILAEPGSGYELCVLSFRNPEEGIWQIETRINNAEMEATTDVEQWQQFHAFLPMQEFLQQTVYFLRPSIFTTITSPGYAHSPMTIVGTQGIQGELMVNEGRGYSIDNEVKPDLTAPGEHIPTILGVRSGSSVAVALAAGVVAQFMEWAVIQNHFPLINMTMCKSFFIRGALRDTNVDYPDPRWGYGRIQLMRVLETLERSR